MTDPDPRLAAFFAKDEPPPHDLAFEVALEAKLARQRLLDGALDCVAFAFAAGVIAWAAQPALAAYSGEIARLFGAWSLPVAAVAASLAAALWILRRQPAL